MNQVTNNYKRPLLSKISDNQDKFKRELENIIKRLSTFENRINNELRSANGKTDLACSTLCHKSCAEFPQIISNPTLRVAQFEPILEPSQGQMLRTRRFLTEEMKMQLLESTPIPKFANIIIQEGKLIIKVKNIQVSLVLIMTKFGYQWRMKQVVYQSARFRQFNGFYSDRLLKYFQELINQIYNISMVKTLNKANQQYLEEQLSESPFQEQYLRQNFLIFISYCCFEAVKYLSISKLTQFEKMTDSLKVSQNYTRPTGQRVEYEILFTLPTADCFGQIGNVIQNCSNQVKIQSKGEDGMVSIIFDIEDGLVCQTQIKILIVSKGIEKQYYNTHYQQDLIFTKLSREYLFELIIAAQEMRLLFLISKQIKQKNIGEDIIFKPFLGFISSQKDFTIQVQSYLNSLKQQKVFLFVFKWQNREIIYQINPFTSEILNEKQFAFKKQPILLLKYEQITRSLKHTILKKYLFQKLKIQNYRISLTKSLPTAFECILSTQQSRTTRQVSLKFVGDCLTQSDILLSLNRVNNGNVNRVNGDQLTENFFGFSRINPTDEFNLGELVQNIILAITYFKDIERIKFLQARQKERLLAYYFQKQ